MYFLKNLLMKFCQNINFHIIKFNALILVSCDDIAIVNIVKKFYRRRTYYNFYQRVKASIK